LDDLRHCRLFKEISDVKQLLLQCPYGHTTQAPLAAPFSELVSSQLHDHANTVRPRPSPVGEHAAAFAVLPCPKASVHLDLPCEEQDKLSCEAAAEREPELHQPQSQQQQQPQQQQHHVAPLLLRGQLLKPSISSAVMLQRAVHAAQHVQVRWFARTLLLRQNLINCQDFDTLEEDMLNQPSKCHPLIFPACCPTLIDTAARAHLTIRTVASGKLQQNDTTGTMIPCYTQLS